ncbi:MAG: TonB-dependent receptor [Paludibacter sp.]|nr:TonB-dependent receptor [Paludibacter sp.]
MKIKFLSYISIFLFTVQSLFALNEAISVTVQGKVIDKNSQPIEYATAALINPKTNEVINGSVSNKNGEFKINKVKRGEYILSISMVGYNKSEAAKLIVDGKESVIEKSFMLSESSELLQDVIITGRKQFIEQSVDKMVINPEVSPTTASENVYDILKKLPGITIDNNDNISLKGLNGVKILIDDKPTYVSGSQLASLLKGLQGKNVDKIEIIDSPSAKYDAEGNSGIINIKTKHTKAHGFNGSVNGGITQTSKFGWNGGLDLNINYGKLNLYGNYSNYNWAGWGGMDATRRFTSTELEGAYQLISSDGEYQGSSHNYKVGADYYLAKNHVISAMFRGNSGHNYNGEDNTTKFTDKYQHVDSMLLTRSDANNKWTNSTYNLNYKWDIDSTGQSLSVDADYALFNFNGTNIQNGQYTSPAGVNTGNIISSNTSQGSNIKIFTTKLDYSLPVNKQINFDAGLKFSFVNTDSHMDMSGYLNQSDHFIYDENIQAGYINGKMQLDKTTFQLGLRLENTYSKGNSVNTNEINDTIYLKLFPSFFVQQQLNDKNTVNFKYSYRIGRPNYDDLNPFRWMVDPYTYNVGNPNLKPQFTHSAGVSHNYKNALITSFDVNYTKGLFTEIIEQDDASKTVYQTTQNLNNSLDMNLSETFQFQPFQWWKFNGTLIGMYKTIQMYDTNSNLLKQPSFMANMTNNFTLPWKLEMELGGKYSSQQLISNIIIRPRYTVDFGIQRKILNDNGMIKIGISDIFKTATGGAYAKYGNVDIDVMNYWDSRRLNISFNYRFGKDKFKTRANRSTSSSEEQSRSSK